MESLSKIIQKQIPLQEQSTMSLTQILEHYETKLTPLEIKEALQRSNFDISAQTWDQLLGGLLLVILLPY